MTFTKIGFKNIWRQRRRNLFSLIAIVIGTTSLINLGGYINRWEYRGLNNSVYASRLGTVTIYKKDGLRFSMTHPRRYTLSPDEQNKIRSILNNDKGIEAIGSSLMMSGLASNGCTTYPFEVKSFDPELDDIFRAKEGVRRWSSDLMDFKKGLPFSQYPEQNMVGLALGLAQLLGKETSLSDAIAREPIQNITEYCEGPGVKSRIAEDPDLQLLGITFDGYFNAIDVDIAHFYTTGIAITEDTKMTAPLRTIQELFQTEHVTTMNVYYYDHDQAERKARELETRLRDAGLDIETYAWNDERINAIFVGPMNFLYVMSAFFGILILSIVVLSIINLTMMNVIERSREIGTLKAIGYQQSMIGKIFFAEGMLLAVIGSIIGLALSLISAFALNASNVMFLPPGAAEPIPLLIIPGLISSSVILVCMVVIVTLTSLVTSYMSSRRSCLELLNHHSA